MDVLTAIERMTVELAARLEADEYFVDVPVVRADDGNALAELRRAQGLVTTKNGRRGVAVVVLPVEADDEQTNLPFGPMTVRASFQVVEHVELNHDASGTGKSSLAVARRVRDVIKSMILEGVAIAVRPDNPCIEAVEIASARNVKAHQVNFRMLEASVTSAQQVGLPVITAVDGTDAIELTCGTDGAEIYFTLDEQYPAAGRAGAQVYAAPIPVPAEGLVVRACAYKAGMVASVVVRRTVTRVAS